MRRQVASHSFLAEWLRRYSPFGEQLTPYFPRLQPSPRLHVPAGRSRPTAARSTKAAVTAVSPWIAAEHHGEGRLSL
jgi:hypothetical protein